LTLFRLLVLHTSGQPGQHVRHIEFMLQYTVHRLVLLTLFSLLVLHTSGQPGQHVCHFEFMLRYGVRSAADPENSVPYHVPHGT
jgi:hypothetical protein